MVRPEKLKDHLLCFAYMLKHPQNLHNFIKFYSFKGTPSMSHHLPSISKDSPKNHDLNSVN